jgi:hypothetical protein
MGNNKSSTLNYKPALKKYLTEKNEKNLEVLLKIADKDKSKTLDSAEINELIESFTDESLPGLDGFLREMKYIAYKSKGKELTFEKVIDSVFIKKIVLLGTGESGKSTFFRQISIFLNLYDDSELEGEKNTIFSNLMITFKKLYFQITENKISFENLENKVKKT